jgi:predicted  nucleic acid-binding Zn-ribbon protein
MDKKSLISEEIVKNIVYGLINEETSKVKRDDFNRVQYKIEELQNSLSETMKEFRKLEDSIPGGLKTLSNGRISGIASNLSDAQKLITQLKDKIRQHKKSTYSQQVDEKKKG